MDIEQISYDLFYFSHSAEMQRWIIETISRLPEKVAKFAVENCRFVSVGVSIHGQALPGRICVDAITRRTKNVWLIVLDERCDEQDAHSIVAHEIAHGWLKHDALSDSLSEDCEIQTANLVRDWGFEGIGANADYCNAPFVKSEANLS